MRINKYLALATGISRRSADRIIAEGRVHLDGKLALIGDETTANSVVLLDGEHITTSKSFTTVILDKPVGYVCSRDGQGSHTVYDLLPKKYHRLKPVGRLDKDSSGLLLLTDDGELANRLTHPRYTKEKVYEIKLDKALSQTDQLAVAEHSVRLEDGPSGFLLEALDDTGKTWQVTMSEGRNRQIRRTFEALGYRVTTLHRIRFGSYELGPLSPGEVEKIN